MKIGQTYKYRKNGTHEYNTIVLLHDYENNLRFLYNIDWDLKVSNHVALYAKLDRILNKSELKEIYKKINSQI